VSSDCVGTLSERVDLENTAQRLELERILTRCVERRAGKRWGKRCPAQMQAECEAMVRRVSPLDRWLYEHAKARFRLNVTRAGPAFASRLATFALATHGVWRGGRPSRSRCKFVRLRLEANARKAAQPGRRWRALDFERHLCTPGPQTVMEELTADTKYDRHALVVPNEARCIANPLSDTCSVPRGARPSCGASRCR
tara:strand:+ start:86 stop:676 length:591 start_codon:yes stop_codon:yes gene_type:complete